MGNFLLMDLLILSPGWSQELISTAGDEFSNASLHMEWSLGEPVIETSSDEEIYLSQGFHQPVMINKIKEDDRIQVYPDPFDLNLIIEFEELESADMYAMVCDMSGKVILILHKLILFNDIPTLDMADGAYILRIYDSRSNVLKTVKLIKLFQL